jgi:Major Facilitator Superfamily
VTGAQARPTTGTYRRVFANREARGLLIAQAASDTGDQAARVAIALLVLQRTGNLLYGALALAVSYLPGVLGQALLGSLADRYPRRGVMLACDGARFFLISGLALLARGDTTLLPVFVLLLTSEFASLPFGTARASLYPDVVVDRSEYIAVQGLSRTVHLATQVLGSIAGGALVDLLGASRTLAVDALTFVVSFVLIRAFVRERPATDLPGTSPLLLLGDMASGMRDLFGDPVRRAITLLGWSSALFLVAPEAIALAYRPGIAPLVGGVLLAAVPAGSALGAVLLPRVPMRDQLRLLLPLAALSCLPLFATSIAPAPMVAAALWFVAGVLQAFVLTVISAVTMLTVQARRGRVLGIASAGFNAATAASFALVGWLAGFASIGPARAVSLAGAGGLLTVAALRAVWPAAAIDQAA